MLTRRDALEAFYESFESDTSISREAFERSGEIVAILSCEISAQGQIVVRRNGTDRLSRPPKRCSFCNFGPHEPDDSDAALISETKKYFKRSGVPFQNTTLPTPIEDTHDVVTCPQCSGRGYIDCSYCDGRGEEDCCNCDGTGQEQRSKECSICEGNDLSCSQCEGDGTVYVIEECRSCHGDGTERCSKCSGSGRDFCGDCYGDGQVHRFEALMRGIGVIWTIHGLPDFWSTADGDSKATTLRRFYLDKDRFKIDWQEGTTARVTIEPVNAKVFDLRYEDESYHAMLVEAESNQFFFDPETGPIETSTRRKLRDLRKRILPWH